MFGFCSLAEVPISTLPIVIFILNGDMFVTSLNINKAADFFSSVNLNIEATLSLNKMLGAELIVNNVSNSDLSINSTTEIIVSR